MPEIEITKERYDEIKKQDAVDANLDVYEEVDNSQDADDIISSMDSYVDEETMMNQDNDQIAYDYDPNKSYVYTAPDNGVYIDKSATVATSTNPGSAYSGSGVNTNCSDIVANFNKNLQIFYTKTQYFTLGEVARDFGRIIDKQVGNKNFTKYQIACNLKALAVNCLGKIKTQYPDMVINSTIRNDGCKSEHETGQAADIIFPKHKKNEYYNIILWIYQNVPFNQLFLEYRPNNSTHKGVNYKGNPRGGWIHISYAQSGNNIYGASKFWGCMVNDKFETPGARQSFTNPMAHCDWTA